MKMGLMRPNFRLGVLVQPVLGGKALEQPNVPPEVRAPAERLQQPWHSSSS